MNWMSRLLSRFRDERAPLVKLDVAKPYEYLSDKDYLVAVSFFMGTVVHQLKRVSKDLGLWGHCLPVKCPEKFAGYGYVEGRTECAKINRKIRITEADDDMDFSECCVLLENQPTLIIYSGRRGDHLFLVNQEVDPLMQMVFDTGAMRITTLADRDRLADPVRRVLEDILRVYMKHPTCQIKMGQAKSAIDHLADY